MAALGLFFKLEDNCFTMLCWFLPYTIWISHIMYMSSPSWAFLPLPIPPLYVFTECQAGLPVLYSNFLPAIYLTHSSVYMSMLHSHFLVVVFRLFVVAHRLLSSCSSQTSCPKACGILVPRPGIQPEFPALKGGFLTTVPPGESPL